MRIGPSEAAALLEWYRAMGVDEAVAEAPASWFAAEPSPLAIAQEAPRPAPSAPRGSATRSAPSAAGGLAAPPPDPAEQAPVSGEEMAARELARRASSLEELRALLETFEGCPLKKTAKRLCFARGAADARVMFIGEAPGKDEDAQGLPFIGRAGKLLDRMLAAAGLTEKDVYITNIVYWRPPGNRTPTPQEAQVCQPFLERQIELVKPEILVFLGNAAAKQLTGAAEGIIKLRGKWLTYPPASSPEHGKRAPIRAIATLHPAYLLRNPIAKRLAWRDLLSIREALDARG